MSQPADAVASQQPPAASHATGRRKLVGHLAMILFAALVSASYSIGALAAPLIGPAAINAVRFLIGIAVMVAVVMAMTGGRIPAPRAGWRYLILGGLMAVFFVTMFMALRLTSPVSAGAVFTLMPLMASFFGWLFLGEVPRGVVLASLAFAGLGSIWVIFNGDVAALLAFEIGRGELIFLIGVAAHAAYGPLVRRLNRGEHTAIFTMWTLAAIGGWLAVYGAREIAATDWTALPTIVWIAVFYLALVTGAGTTFLVQFATMRLPAAKVMAYTYLSPCFIIFYEGLLGHGWASATVLAGALVTVLGLAVMAVSRDS